MSIAAVPGYLGQDFSLSSPGMRYGMYLDVWNRQWGKIKSPVLNSICRLNSHETALIAHLNQRQQLHANAIDDDAMMTIFGKSISPFTTGLGNEHPLENGFAFLWPYGLPYLPGSGVKGVLRQAARELISGEWEESDWSDEVIATIMVGKKIIELTATDTLFGKESQSGESEHFRGVLSFWDVIPRLSGDTLQVEVMTPHQQHYYQGGESPHDSGTPVPITFLTLPPESSFTFHVACDTARLNRVAPTLLESENNELPQWKTLLQHAFTHAFNWLGFGAKTTVGYGAIEPDQQAIRNAEENATKQREEVALAALSEEERQIAELRKQFESDKAANYKDPGGPLNEQRLKLLQSALSWDATEYRKQAADLIRETAIFLPWSKKRKKEIKEQLDKLEDTQ